MVEAQTTSSFKLHRLSRWFDPEVLAVLTILIGLFQGLLGIPAYFIHTSLPALFICPLFAGVVQVTVGSLAMTCERSPSRNLLRTCLYVSVFGMLVTYSAVVVYSCALKDLKSNIDCNPERPYCVPHEYTGIWSATYVGLLFYDISGIILQSFLSYSALKSLKSN